MLVQRIYWWWLNRWTNLVALGPCCWAWAAVLAVRWSHFPFLVAFLHRRVHAVLLDNRAAPWTVDSASSDCELVRRVENVEIAATKDALVAMVEVMNSKTEQDKNLLLFNPWNGRRIVSITGKKAGAIGPPGKPSFAGNWPRGLGAGPEF